MSEAAKHSRRAAIGALASVPALALPVAAIASSVLADPAFAAIDCHRGALGAFLEAIPRSDSVVAKEQGREVSQAETDACEAAMDAEEDALFAALAAPTTIAGLRATLEYLAQLDGGAVPEDAREVASLLLQSPFLAA